MSQKFLRIIKIELPTKVSIMNDHHLPRVVHGAIIIYSAIRMGPGVGKHGVHSTNLCLLLNNLSKECNISNLIFV